MMYRIEPEYLILEYLSTRKVPVSEDTLMNDIRKMNLELIRRDIYTGVSFRDGAFGRSRSPEIVSALRRLIDSGIIIHQDDVSGVMFELSKELKAVADDILEDHKTAYKSVKGNPESIKDIVRNLDIQYGRDSVYKRIDK